MDAPITDVAQFNHFIQWAFYALLCGATVIGVSSLRGIQASIVELNIRVAVMLERMSSHEKNLESHHERITVLEHKTNNVKEN